MKPRSQITNCNLKLLIWPLMPLTQNTVSTPWTCLVEITFYDLMIFQPLCPFLPGVCCWHQVGALLPRSLQLCRSSKKSTVASKLSWLCRWSARCTVRSKQHVHIIVLIVYYVHMQLCLNPVAAIWINWRAKTYLYLLAVHINELFKSAIKWGKPLCCYFWPRAASVGGTSKVVFS